MKVKLLHLAFILTMMFVTACSLEKETVGQYTVDTEITTKIKGKLLKERDLKSREIHVETYKGDVQLSGFVKTNAEARKARRLASSVKDVKSVQNNIIVQ